MKRVIDTGLPEFGRPTSHAVVGGGHLRTTAVPLKSDGTFETGDAKIQIDLALRNLRQTLDAAGGKLDDVIQALVFLTDADHVSILNEAWRSHFKEPYPNRGIVIVNAIGVPRVVILISVHAYIEALL
jgi:enamine deaminase RidA (YjgF/YER057c/UK114 family)